jgi:hypothetical protein
LLAKLKAGKALSSQNLDHRGHRVTQRKAIVLPAKSRFLAARKDIEIGIWRGNTD